MTAVVVVTAPAAVALTWVLTGWVRRYAIVRSLLDVPNVRSSHQEPVPRGGGLAVAIVILGGLVAGGLMGWVERDVALALVGGGTLVTVVGWIDDHRGLRPLIRATVQVLAACWALAWLGGLPGLQLGDEWVHLGTSGWILGVLGIVWAANLYNFMDGIDGLAGGEALSVALAGTFLLFAAGDAGLGWTATLIAAAAAGFLLWNWSPARIFLGDVGSGLLGFLFGALAVASENAGALPVVGWLLLLGVFFVDATITVARRMVKGERWYEAHRKHAYQRLVQAGRSHAWVASAVVAVNVLLAGLVWLGWRNPDIMPATLALGFGILGGLYWLIEVRRPMYPSV